MYSNERGTEKESVFYNWHSSSAARSAFLYPIYLGHYFCNQAYDVNRSRLDSFLLMYVRSGSGSLTDAAGEHSLTEGDLVLVDCYRPHHYFTRTGWEIYWVHFDGRMARELYRYAEGQNRLQIPAAGGTALRRFRRLLEPFERETAADEALLSKLINDLLTQLLISPDYADAASGSEIDEAMRYMSEHLNEKITLEILARQANMSPFYFAHLFKNETGTTPHQYLTEIRLEVSCYLLRTGNLMIQEIADRCGFANAGAFCACFKTHTGCTPRQYRDLKP